ncbi:MAG TPA: hypothetical protein VGK73_34380, partial [Polyangiaceae bacterium]
AGAGAGGAGAGGTGGSAGAGEILRETSDGVETVPNDTRETAVAVSQPSTATIFVAGGSDEDWFSVTPPLDGKTHVISVEIAQDAGVGQQLRAYTLANHAQMGFYDFAGGSTGYVHATAGPGATILFRFFRSSGNISTGLAHLSFDFEVENDAHEPNDTKQTAAPIELDTTYSAMMTDPWVSDLDRPVQDWFAVDLEAGTATVALSAVPSQGRIEVYRVNPAGGSTQLGANNTGETRTFSAFSVPEAGTYYVMFQPYSGTSGFVKGVKPTYLTEPYTFRVTQP